MGASTVDIVVTSPPYNIGVDYGAYQDNKSTEEYLSWCGEWASEVARLLKPDGSFFLNMGVSSANPMLAFSVALRLGQLLHLQNTIHWIKSITIERVNADGHECSSYGHIKPINSPRYLNDCHEYLFHFTPHGNTKIDRLAVGVPYADKSNIARWAHTGKADKRCRGNNWFIPYKTIQSRAEQRPHPATFPVELQSNTEQTITTNTTCHILKSIATTHSGHCAALLTRSQSCLTVAGYKVCKDSALLCVWASRR